MNETLAEMIDRYERGGPLLIAAVAGLGDEASRRRVGPGTWSVAEVAVHMLDSDLVGIDRMKRVIAEEHPTLLAYDQDAWIARLDSNSLPADEAAVLFAGNRSWMARVLRARPEGDFARTGVHTETGVKTLADLVVGYVGHLDGHLRHLYGKRGTLGSAIIPRYSRDESGRSG